MNEALEGKNFKLSATIAGVSKRIVCATSVSIAFNTEMKEATKPAGGRFRSYYPGVIDYKMTVEGVYSFINNSGEISANELLQFLLSGNELEWKAQDSVHESVVYRGFALVGALALIAPAEGFHNFTTTLQGTGAVMIGN